METFCQSVPFGDTAMRCVQDGLYLAEEEMPCTPRQIRIGHYFIAGVLGRSEQEEAAARIISFSQHLDQWVGVSGRVLVEMMKRDCEIFSASKEKHAGRRRVWGNQMDRWFWLNVLTFGIWGWFAEKPKFSQSDLDQPEVIPFSGIYLFGPDYVVTGIRELWDRNLLNAVPEHDGQGAFNVFFPTPALISHIIKKQGIGTPRGQ